MVAAEDSLVVRSRAYQEDRAHVFHSWSAQRSLDPLVIAGGEGSRFWDEQGRSYLDFSSQLVNLNLGHQHPVVVRAIQEQAALLCTVAPTFANAARSEAARLIAEVAPGDLRHVFFRQIEILGSTMGSKGALFAILEHVKEGRLKPVVDRVMPLWSAREAHRALESRDVFGKIVLEVD